MRAGDPDADMTGRRHQLAQEGLPGDDGDAGSLGGGELGVVRQRPQCRGDRHAVDAREVCWIVADLPADAGGVEGRGVRGWAVGVAAIDLGAGALQEEPGTRGSGPRDPDHVDVLAGPDHPDASDATRLASSSAASADARLFPSRSCGQV